MRPSTHMWIGLAVLLALHAAKGADAAELRVGFVDQRRAVLSSNEGLEADRAVQELKEKKQEELAPKQTECRRLREEIETQRFVIKREALQERLLDQRACERDLERRFAAAQDEIALRERRMLSPVLERFSEALASVGSELDIILDKSSPGLLFYQDGLDVTDRVVERMNRKPDAPKTMSESR